MTDYNDRSAEIVGRLRVMAQYLPEQRSIFREAASEIERLSSAPAQAASKPYGWHAPLNGMFTIDDAVANVWRGHMGLEVTPVYLGSDGSGGNQPEQRTGPHRASGETNSGATGDSELTRSARQPSDPQCSAGNGGDFCTYGPPAERKRRWIILFDDPDKGTMVFDDEKEAHTAWDRAKDNWTCTLFETSERKYQWAAGQLRPLNEPQTVWAPAEEVMIWLDEQIDQAASQQQQSYAMRGEYGQRQGERWHARQCALYEAKLKLAPSLPRPHGS